ncbi:glycosyltransferase family 2 protein [Microbacterium lacus]|uniref:glycosyltransferase family 2 protein n=1 Tax=Microbacterium lacus TaxID=415217 RepID=UPI003850D0DC
MVTLQSRLRVSVVIPAKNDAEMLRRCLAALSHQTLPAHEIIVVDNGSRDHTVAVACDAGAWVLVQPEPGILAASARGYDAAEGDIIARIDADCVPAAEWLSRVVAAFEKDAALAAVTGPARFVDGPLRSRTMLARAYLAAYYASLFPALGHVPLFGSNMAMRRDAWTAVSADVHRHDPFVHDDLEVAFHLGERHRIRYVRSLSMGISGRPFDSLSAFGLRLQRGFHTVTTHWPGQFPPLRWTRRAFRRRGPVSLQARRITERG